MQAISKVFLRQSRKNKKNAGTCNAVHSTGLKYDLILIINTQYLGSDIELNYLMK